MPIKKNTPEQIIAKPREAEVLLAQGQSTGAVCRTIGITQHTYHRWRKEYGGLKVDKAKYLKELESENSRMKRLVADLSFGSLLPKERTSSCEKL